MRRAICRRRRSFEIRSRPEGFVYAFSWRRLSGACLELPTVTSSQAWRLGLVTEYFPVCNHDKPGRVCLAALPVCNAILRFGWRCLGCCCISFPRCVTPSLRLVTLTLQACNAKKISAESTAAKSIVFNVFACNVGKNASIFHEITQVSCVQFGSIGFQMLSKFCTSVFPFGPSSVSIIVRFRACCQSVLQCRVSNGGTS